MGLGCTALLGIPSPDLLAVQPSLQVPNSTMTTWKPDNEPSWFWEWMHDTTGRTPVECGEPPPAKIAVNACPTCGAWEPKVPDYVPYDEKEFTLKHRQYEIKGKIYREVNLSGERYEFVSNRAFRALENAKINNVDELKDSIGHGELIKYRNCGRKTVRELSELVEEYENKTIL